MVFYAYFLCIIFDRLRVLTLRNYLLIKTVANSPFLYLSLPKVNLNQRNHCPEPCHFSGPEGEVD